MSSLIDKYADDLAIIRAETAAYEEAMLPLIKRLNAMEERLVRPIYEAALTASDADLLEIIRALPSSLYRSELRAEYNRRVRERQ
jgi:hypothetical protein